MRKQLSGRGFRVVLCLFVVFVMVGVFLKYSEPAASQRGNDRTQQPSEQITKQDRSKQIPELRPTWSEAFSFHETPALKKLRPVRLSKQVREALEQEKQAPNKNKSNTLPISPPINPKIHQP